ncbi:MAG: hypothetical protein QNK05_03390 [Myxococcota bacterium]|nr:hypothetical protein [Myxococcota bacterium]
MQVLESAELFVSASASLPDDARFERVDLPDRWILERRRHGTSGWYRLHFEAPETPSSAQAIWIDSLYPNGEVFVNGTRVGSGGRLEDPPARNRFRPVYLGFPGELIQPGRNEITIRYVGTEGSIGLLSAVRVGPESALWPLHQRTLAIGIDTLRVGLVLALLLAGILWIGSLGDEAPAGNRWFAAGLLGLCIGSMSAYTADLAIPSRLVEWTVVCALHWMLLAFAIGVSRALATGTPPPVRGWVVAYAALSVGAAAVPALYLPAVWFLWGLPTLLVCGRMFWKMGQRVLAHGELRWAPALAVGAITLATPALSRWLPPPDPFVSLAPLSLVAAVATHLFLQLRDAQRRTAELNRGLEARVAEREAELAANYVRLRDLEREQAVAAERQRLTRDMHDGVGGHVVSALSQVRTPGSDPSHLERTLEEALFDLRLTVDSLQPGASDLPALLGALRSSLARRADQAGMQLRWQISDAGEGHALPPDAVLHVIRLVQEAVTNAIRHSKGRIVSVSTRAEPGGVALAIEDDGEGGLAPREGGNGLRHLHERAQLLGSELRTSSDATGTRIELTVPLTERAAS